MMIALIVRHLQHSTDTCHDAKDIQAYSGVLEVYFELALDESQCHVLEKEGEGDGEGES